MKTVADVIDRLDARRRAIVERYLRDELLYPHDASTWIQAALAIEAERPRKPRPT